MGAHRPSRPPRRAALPAGGTITCTGTLSEYDVHEVLELALDLAHSGAVTILLR